MKALSNFLTVVFCLINMTVIAQKLPSVQKDEVFMPDKVTIDGTADEWDTLFKAYNASISANYTLANNNENIYVIIHVPRVVTIEKVLAGGITLIIKNPNKANNAGTFSITYPLMSGSERMTIINRLRDTTQFLQGEIKSLNALLQNSAKIFQVSGSDVAMDSLVSIYNEYGISISHKLNPNRAYTIECMVPIKYFKSKLNDQSIKYDIQFNGMKSGGFTYKLNGVNASASSPQVDALLQQFSSSGNQKNLDFVDLITPTSVSGVYIMATKK